MFPIIAELLPLFDTILTYTPVFWLVREQLTVKINSF